jgi:hypothetical protein
MMAIATKFKKVNIIISAFQICPCEDYDNLLLSSEEILKKEHKLHFVVNVIRYYTTKEPQVDKSLAAGVSGIVPYRG